MSRITRGLHSSGPGRTVAHRATWPPPGGVPLCPARRARSRPLPLGQHTVSMNIQTPGLQPRAAFPRLRAAPTEPARGDGLETRGARTLRPRPTADRLRRQRQQRQSATPSLSQAVAAVVVLPLPSRAAAATPHPQSSSSSGPGVHRSAREQQPRGLRPPDWTGSPRSSESEGYPTAKRPAVHPNRLGRGLPLQRPAEASSAGPRRER
jgi:hypothetical protein